MGNELSGFLDDPEYRAELELFIEVVIAANESEDRLSPQEVDRALGLEW